MVQHVNDPSRQERITSLTYVATQALSRYGLEHVRPVLLEESTNTIFRVHPSGQHHPSGRGAVDQGSSEGFALRIHAPGMHSTQEIQEELQWLLALRHDTDLVVPTPVPAGDGSLVQEVVGPGESTPRQCVLLRWVPGAFRDETLTPSELQRVGAFMARLHCHAEQCVALRTPRPSRLALFCDVPAWIHDSHQATALFSAPALDVLTAAAQWVRRSIQDLGEARDVYGFIHADLHQENYLFHGDTVGAIDFDDCGWGYYAYDMAVTLSFLEDRPAFPAMQDAFLTGYQSVRPLPRHYAACFDVFLALRFLVIVAWILTWPRPSYKAWGPAYLQEAVVRLRHFLERHT